MGTALTDLAVRKLSPPDKGQTFHHDASHPNFGVCVSHGGTKSFFVFATVNGRRKRITLGRYPTISLSQARAKGQTPEQKVIFKYKGLNLAELEMRNDSTVHYREIRFNMIKMRALDLLFSNIARTGQYSNEVWLYGTTTKRFGRWRRG